MFRDPKWWISSIYLRWMCTPFWKNRLTGHADRQALPKPLSPNRPLHRTRRPSTLSRKGRKTLAEKLISEEFYKSECDYVINGARQGQADDVGVQTECAGYCGTIGLDSPAKYVVLCQFQACLPLLFQWNLRWGRHPITGLMAAAIGPTAHSRMPLWTIWLGYVSPS